MSTQENMLIKAEPTKHFFVDMLVRDIGLTDCILDLVDNSIGNFIKHTELDVTEELFGKKIAKLSYKPKISISLKSDKFSIEDNCGGISIEKAQNEVFRFGSLKGEKGFTGLSVYGIGMKRAFFKIGKNISVQSMTQGESFLVDIDVEKWKEEKEWNFKFKSTNRFQKKIHKEKTGTRIEITGLHPGVSKRLETITSQNDMAEKISSVYALFLKQGIEIELFGRALRPHLPTIARASGLEPARKKINYSGVDILILAGVSPGEDKRPHGWYVFCNGRMVISADKSEMTGWGNGLPLFRPKYNHFVGYVYFHSTNPEKLPWTTTKHGVEFDAPVYQETLREMIIVSKPITSFLNKLYPDLKEEEAAPSERSVMNSAKAVNLTEVSQKSSKFKFPESVASTSKEVTIAYKRNIEDIEKIREQLKKPKLSASKIGEHTFDFFLKNECE